MNLTEAESEQSVPPDLAPPTIPSRASARCTRRYVPSAFRNHQGSDVRENRAGSLLTFGGYVRRAIHVAGHRWWFRNSAVEKQPVGDPPEKGANNGCEPEEP